MLRKPETDPLLLQLRVELTIWKKLDFSTENLIKNTTAYKLFCIFNRFCNCGDFPMEIGPHEVTFLFHTFKMDRDSNIPRFLKLDDFIKLFDKVNTDLLNKFYDEFILDLVIHGEVKAKIKHNK